MKIEYTKDQIAESFSNNRTYVVESVSKQVIHWLNKTLYDIDSGKLRFTNWEHVRCFVNIADRANHDTISMIERQVDEAIQSLDMQSDCCNWEKIPGLGGYPPSYRLLITFSPLERC
jgi:hypothetical protein